MNEKTAYTHDYSGSCAPTGQNIGYFEKFSVGIFEWLPKSGGDGLKKGKVKVRVNGNSLLHQEVYAKAREICKLLDRNEYHGPKNVTVK